MNGLLNSINGFSFISFEQIVICKCLCNGFVVQLNGDRFLSREKKHVHYRYIGFINFCGINAEADLHYHPHKDENVPPPHTIFSGVEKSLFKNA